MLVAIQTILGQVNSELHRNVTRMIRSGAVSRLHGTLPGRSVGGKSENGQEPKGLKGPPLQEEIRQTIRMLRDALQF